MSYKTISFFCFLYQIRLFEKAIGNRKLRMQYYYLFSNTANKIGSLIMRIYSIARKYHTFLLSSFGKGSS